MGIDANDYVFEFGTNTMFSLNMTVEKTFKVLWDGSISLFKDCMLANTNNKSFVSHLLDMRQRTS
jgi:hypothetical protein